MDPDYVDLKISLGIAPTLRLPKLDIPFTQFVYQKDSFMTSVLTQSHGGSQRPVAYFSNNHDLVAAGHPLC